MKSATIAKNIHI